MTKRTKTGGRRKGTPNKATQKRAAAFRALAFAIGEAIPDAFKGDAHAFLIAVYKDPRVDIGIRSDAAKAAIRYEKPALASVENSGPGGGPQEHTVTVKLVGSKASK